MQAEEEVDRDSNITVEERQELDGIVQGAILAYANSRAEATEKLLASGKNLVAAAMDIGSGVIPVAACSETVPEQTRPLQRKAQEHPDPSTVEGGAEERGRDLR